MADVASGTNDVRHDAARRALRWALPIVVFAVLFGITASASLVVQGVVRDQDRRLLAERTEEGALLLSSSLSGITSSLQILAAFPDPEATIAQFTGSASISIVRAGESAVMASSGSAPAVGTQLSEGRAALATRAHSASNVVTALIREGGVTRIVFALASPASDQVLFTDLPVDPSKPTEIDFFRDLDGAVYTGPGVAADQVAFATTLHLPLRGDVVGRQINVGADTWYLEVKATRPLVGSFAAVMHRFLFAGGVVVALLVSVLVEVLLRRRAYAIRLVEQRTAQLEAARQAADAANTAKSEFLSRMSHELRTPLNAVLGFAQLLDLETLDAPKQESVDQILRGGRHLLDLINEVLEISTIETGNLSLSSEPVPVEELVAEVIDLARTLAEREGVTFLGQHDAFTGTHVLADRQRLMQVLLNLVSNAIKYNVAGGTVSVAVRPQGDGLLRIEVSDTGPGISTEHLTRLFRPFERLGAEHTDVEGTGIGLALSKRLAEAMGGTLGVSSEPGRGSTFWIELPEVEGPLERFERLNESDPVSDSIGRSRPRHTIVYIEDNLSNLRLVDRVLSRNDEVEVISSMQGRLGVDLVREHQPAFVLLDLHLPDISGEEVLRQLRHDPRTAKIPVVVVSADATAGQVERLMAAGAHAYLTKPLDLARLITLLDELIAAPA